MKKLFFFLLGVVSFQFMVFLLFREQKKLPKSYGENG